MPGEETKFRRGGEGNVPEKVCGSGGFSVRRRRMEKNDAGRKAQDS